MLDTHVHKHEIASAYPQTVTQTVTHHNAPTIESVRLLREMEAAAFAAVVWRGEVHSNSNSIARVCVVQWPHKPAVLCLEFYLNHEPFRIEVETFEMKMFSDKSEIAAMATRKIAEAIARNLVLECVLIGAAK